MEVILYDGHRSNSGHGDSIHGSTAVAVTELTVDEDDRAVVTHATQIDPVL